MPGRDAALIGVAAFLRSATVGLVGVVLAIYLSEVGLTVTAIGVVIGAGLMGATVATLLIGVRADTFGRRRTLIGLAILNAAGYVAFALSNQVAVLMLAAFCGMVNGMGRDRGAASALEQAILPETTGPDGRTWVLAWYNLVLDAGHAVGALAGATPTLLMRVWHIDALRAHHVTLGICAGAMALSVLPYVGLTPGIEVVERSAARAAVEPFDPPTRRVVARLAMLFGIDSIGGGFLSSSLIAYWFFQRYGTSEGALAVLFFAARLLNAGSHVIAAWMARRIGLVKTMVLTHLPSSVLLMMAPAAPTAPIAAALFLAREALVEMDVPTRQSYVMALVRPRERTRASSVTNVTRTVAWAVGTTLAGVVMQHVALAGPLFIGGALKIAYDLILYRSFRHLKPPEEQPPPIVASP